MPISHQLASSNLIDVSSIKTSVRKDECNHEWWKIRKFFANDLAKEGTNKVVINVPDGDVTFIFCKIKGRNSEVQAFIDGGCNCAIARDGIPLNELRSCKFRYGPISIDVATDQNAYANGEWGFVLPLSDGSYLKNSFLSLFKKKFENVCLVICIVKRQQLLH